MINRKELDIEPINASNLAESLMKQEMAQKERIIYKACKQKAEAIIWLNQITTENIEHQVFKTTQSYKICDTIEEVTNFKNFEHKSFHYQEIPAYMHRIAENTEDFTDFKYEIKLLHPNL